MADDLGAGEPSFTTPGKLSTPHLDRLASDGMRFTAAYAGYTVCAPSRATLFTGRNSGHLGGAPFDWPLLPRLLRAVGYETVMFGKSAPMDAIVPPARPSTLVWGLPDQYGFDHFAGQPSQGLCHNMYPGFWTTAGNRTTPLPLNLQPKSRAQCMAHPQSFNYTTDLFADATIDWLRSRPNAATATHPFFAYLSFTVPHAGGWGSAPKAPEQGQPVPSDLGYAVYADWPQVERDHAASVSYLDQRIGDVLQVIAERGFAPRTAVFFASDNGAHNEGGHSVRFFDSTGGLRGFKRSFYEGGVRSPSLVRWPGVTPRGSVSDVPWAFWDVLPTLLEMAGAPVGLLANATIDGRSIVPALRGEPMAAPEYMFWTWRGAVADDAEPTSEAMSLRRPRSPPGYAARVGAWKVVVHKCADQRRKEPSVADVMELYNLTADPFEATNVAAVGDGPRIVGGIKQLLGRHALTCQCYQC